MGEKKGLEASSQDDVKTKEALLEEIKQLREEQEQLKEAIFRAKLERDIYEKAAEVIKKDQGVSLKELSNKEKVTVIDALRNKYKLKLLLEALDIPKSSYCYNAKVKYTSKDLKVVESIGVGDKRIEGNDVDICEMGSGVPSELKIINDEIFEETLNKWEWDIVNNSANKDLPFNFDIAQIYEDPYDMLYESYTDKEKAKRIIDAIEFCKQMREIRTIDKPKTKIKTTNLM